MNAKTKKINSLLKEYEENIDVNYSLETPYTLIISSYRLTEDIIYTYFDNCRQNIDVPLRRYLRHENFPYTGYGLVSNMRKYKNKAVHKYLSLHVLSSFLKNFNLFLEWFNKFYSTKPLKSIEKITKKINLIIDEIASNNVEKTDLKKLINCEKNLEKLKNDAKISFSKENEEKQIEEINILLEVFENQLRILKERDNFFDIIILGQKLSESIVELYLNSQNYPIKKYFIEMIRDCRTNDILPNECLMFLSTIRRYRNKGIHGDKPSFDIISPFINALKYYLIWFNTFYSGKYSLKEPFNIEKSVILINLINEIGRTADESVENQITCPQCGSEDLIVDYEKAELVCNKCGLVIDENLVDIPDLFVDSKESDIRSIKRKNRAIKNELLVSTSRTINDFDEYILDRNETLRKRLRKMQKDALKIDLRVKYPFLSYDLNKICSKLNLQKNIQDITYKFLRNVLDEELDRGISLSVLIPASIYINCRQYNVCRTLDEIAKVSEVDKKEVEEACNSLVNELNINLPPISIIDFVPRFAYEIDYSEDVLFLSTDIIGMAIEKGFVTNENPIEVAVTSLYIASVLLNEKKPQEEVEGITNITEDTILKLYDQFIEEGVIEEITLSQRKDEIREYPLDDLESIVRSEPSLSKNIERDISSEDIYATYMEDNDFSYVTSGKRVEDDVKSCGKIDDVESVEEYGIVANKSDMISVKQIIDKQSPSRIHFSSKGEVDLSILEEKDISKVIEETNRKIEQLIKENEFKNNLLIQLANQVTMLQTQLNDIQQSAGRIEEKVDIILNEIKKVNQTVEAIQEFTTNQIKNSNSKIEIENIREIFSEQYINQLQSYSEEASKKESYEIERIKLEDSMGDDAWNKLSEKSKTFLITAKVLYNDLLRIKYIADYSGICILVTKALEEEIFKRFFIDFIDYLDEKYNKDYSQYHTALLFKDGTILYENRFTMGNIAFVLCFKENKYDTPKKIKNNDEKLMEYCKDHIFSNKTEEDIRELLNEYAGYIEKIRKDYRNPSAHRNAIKKVNAKECLELVLDVEKLLKRMLESFDN